MGFDNVVFIRSEATNYYLSGSTKTAYTGSGTPWTAEATSPYRLSLNDLTPIWVPGPALTNIITEGGPPFVTGRLPLYRSYDNVTEQVGVLMYANSADNAVFLLRQLRQILNTALFSLPALLSVQGGTNTTYYEIYGGDVVETSSYLAEGNTTNVVIRATITWTRAAHGGVTSLTTLQNGITVTNSGTGANNNTRSLGALTGDLIYDGMPLNVKLSPDVGASGVLFYFATVYQRTYTTAIAGSDTTSSTVGSAAWTDTTASLSDPARTRNGLRFRAIVRLTSISAKARLRISLISKASLDTLWRGPWCASLGDTGVCIVDATPQGVPLDVIRRAGLESGDVSVFMEIKSTDGTSITVNTHSAEFLLYYTFCRIDFTTSIGGAAGWLQIEQAQNLNGTAWVPCRGVAYGAQTTSTIDYIDHALPIRGTLPRAVSGASLYFNWCDLDGGHDNTDTATVTTQLLPIYQTLRGGA